MTIFWKQRFFLIWIGKMLRLKKAKFAIKFYLWKLSRILSFFCEAYTGRLSFNKLKLNIGLHISIVFYCFLWKKNMINWFFFIIKNLFNCILQSKLVCLASCYRNICWEQLSPLYMMHELFMNSFIVNKLVHKKTKKTPNRTCNILNKQDSTFYFVRAANINLLR